MIGGVGGIVMIVFMFFEFIVVVGEKNMVLIIVVICGVIMGNEKVCIGSNKSIIGLFGFGLRGIGLYFCR